MACGFTGDFCVSPAAILLCGAAEAKPVKREAREVDAARHPRAQRGRQRPQSFAQAFALRFRPDRRGGFRVLLRALHRRAPRPRTRAGWGFGGVALVQLRQRPAASQLHPYDIPARLVLRRTPRNPDNGGVFLAGTSSSPNTLPKYIYTYPPYT